MEIVCGFQKKQRPHRLQSFLANIASEEELAFDQAAAELAGRIQGELERVGEKGEMKCQPEERPRQHHS